MHLCVEQFYINDSGLQVATSGDLLNVALNSVELDKDQRREVSPVGVIVV